MKTTSAKSMFRVPLMIYCILTALSAPALAGGYLPCEETSNNTESTCTSPNQSTATHRASDRPYFTWRQWSQTYQPPSLLCRERTGNLVCFTRSQAERQHWLTNQQSLQQR